MAILVWSRHQAQLFMEGSSKGFYGLQWMDPKELHGVGQYAADAYNIFCRGDWRSVSPTDKDLLKYHQWLMETNGEGSGLLRETEPQLCAPGK